MKKISSATAWMVIFVLVILVALLLVRTNQSSTAISFNQFQKSWLSNNIKSFQLGEDKMTVRGSLKNWYPI